MEVKDTERLRLARRAYEKGRLRWSLQALLFFTPMVTVAACFGGEAQRALILGGILAALGIGFLWRGTSWARGTWQGIAAGIVPMMLPLFTRTSDTCCTGGNCFSACMVACIAGGVFAGAVVGYFVYTRGFNWRQMIATTIVASLSGALGCGVTGVMGIVGMVTAMALVSTPVLVMSRLRVPAA